MLSGALPGTGVITRRTGTHGARTTGITTTDITITGTIITTCITATGIIPVTTDIMTFITATYGHILLM